MNKFQILGTISVALAFVSIVTFYMYRPKSGVDSPAFSLMPQVILSLAVASSAIALLLSNDDGLNGESYMHIPHTVHDSTHNNVHDNFIMREGLQKQHNQPSGTESLGMQLKNAGWVVCVADWCGFCNMQKELFSKHPEEQLDILIVNENEMTPELKAMNEGFPAWCNVSRNLKSPGYKKDLNEIRQLLDMN